MYKCIIKYVHLGYLKIYAYLKRFFSTLIIPLPPPFKLWGGSGGQGSWLIITSYFQVVWDVFCAHGSYVYRCSYEYMYIYVNT